MVSPAPFRKEINSQRDGLFNDMPDVPEGFEPDVPEGFQPDLPVGFEPDELKPVKKPSPIWKAIREGAAAFNAGVLGPQARLQAALPEKVIQGTQTIQEDAGRLLSDTLNRSGLDPSAMPGRNIFNIPVSTKIPGTGFSPLEALIGKDSTKGLEEKGSEILSGFTEPGQLATLPLLKYRPVQALMTGGALAQVPQDIEEVAGAKTQQERAAALTQTAANIGMAYLLGRHLKESTRAPIPEIAPVTKSVPAVEETKPLEAPPAGESGEAKPGEAPVSAAVESPVKAGETPQAIAESDTTAPPEQAKNVTGDVTDVLEPPVVQAGAAHITEIPETGSGGEKYGIAQRLREERAKAGQVDPVQPGEGTNPPDSIQHGRDLLASDPTLADQLLTSFEADPRKQISHDLIAATRARGEQLAQAARKLEREKGTESSEYQAARKALSEWDARTKPIQTEWAKQGMAQQGETDIDTGSFTGLERAHRENTGKDFTPEQAEKAKTIAAKAGQAEAETQTAQTKLFDEIGGPERIDARVKSIAERIIAAMDAAGQSALKRIQARRAEGRLTAGLDPLDLADHVIYGASKIAKGAVEFGKWSSEMIKDLGDYVKPELDKIWTEANKQADAHVAQGAPAPLREKVRNAVRRARDPEKSAIDAAKKTVRDAAVDRAKAETKARVAQTEAERKTADIQRDNAQKALDAAKKTTIEAATRAAEKERKLQADPEARVWNQARIYLEKGVDDFDELRHKVATDLGMKVGEVTKLMARNQRAKFLADEVWRKKQVERRIKSQAKNWVQNLEVPGYQKALGAIPSALFSIRVGFHGTVALGTHAPTVAFQPKFWSAYAQNFGKMYRMVGSPTYFEHQMQDLVRRPNYTTARRAGLINDPFLHEEFATPEVAARMSKLVPESLLNAFSKVSRTGNRGYSVLKLLRQDMFDQMWEGLPKTSQIPEVAAAIADGLNHSTGVVQGKAPKGANLALFAPRLEASRVMWLFGDPIRAAKAFSDWKNAGPGEKTFAIQQAKEKAWVLGTLGSMLAINQGILTATGSKQKINFTDPFRSDWLKFKVAGMNASYGNAMLSMARFPFSLVRISMSDGGKLKALNFPDEDAAKLVWRYARSQMSPFASLATDLFFKADFQERPLPSSNRPVPARLRAQGIKPYTWNEYLAQQAAPIPAQEFLKEAWKPMMEVWKGQGMTDADVDRMKKAVATIVIMGGTGGRLTEDVPYKSP